MKSIFTCTDEPLVFLFQPSPLEPNYHELRAGCEVIGTLRWSILSDHSAVMRLPGGYCVIQRGGLLWSEIAALRYGSMPKLMTFRIVFDGMGRAGLAHTPQYFWYGSGCESIWTDNQHQPLIEFKRELEIIHLTLTTQAERCSELPELIALGCYMWVSHLNTQPVLSRPFEKGDF